MHLKHLSLAAGLLLASAGAAMASPAVVTNDLNLRSGPGTRYAVVATMPAGATVNVMNCGGAWCRVSWGDAVGFASRSYLGNGGPGPAYVVVPPPVVYAPPPVFAFGFGWGGGWHHWHHW